MPEPVPSDDTVVTSARARIDGVVDRLDEVVDWAIASRSRIGYFAAIYRRVTITIGDGVEAGRFPDPDRIAAFDESFAMRFLDALAQFKAGKPPTEAWAVAFGAARRADLSILQQLLLGINAHIRLDLGVTAATLAPNGDLRPLRAGFEAINSVLAGLVPRDRLEVEDVSPGLRHLDRVSCFDCDLVDAWLAHARAGAWAVAEGLAPLDTADRDEAIVAVDRSVARKADRLMAPDVGLRFVLRYFVARRDNRDVAAVIEALR